MVKKKALILKPSDNITYKKLQRGQINIPIKSNATILKNVNQNLIILKPLDVITKKHDEMARLHIATDYSNGFTDLKFRCIKNRTKNGALLLMFA